MGMLSEFRAFAMRGNVIDLAVGVIIGAAFGKIVDSLVNDIIMPLISALLGGRLDFTNLFVPLGAIPAGVPATYDALKKAGVPLFAYGSFITVLLNFVLLAFVIFLLIRQVNRFSRGLLEPVAAPAPGPTPTEEYLKEIRDLMARQTRA